MRFFSLSDEVSESSEGDGSSSSYNPFGSTDSEDEEGVSELVEVEKYLSVRLHSSASFHSF